MKLTLKNNTKKRKQIASRLNKSIRKLEKYIKKTMKNNKKKRSKTFRKYKKRGGNCGCVKNKIL